MIKINLALMKQPVIGSETKSVTSLSSLSSLNINTDALKVVPWPLLILVIAVIYFANLMVEGHKEQELAKLDQEMQLLEAQQSKLMVEMNKTRGYEALKKALDADELTLKTKMETITQLMNERTIPPKLLISLSSSTPPEVWLNEFQIKDQNVTFKGAAAGFSQVSDFMKNLGENIYFKDLTLKSTVSAKDPVTGEVANFELEAKRR
jgi:Tfp pilus assembly protein PilN